MAMSTIVENYEAKQGEVWGHQIRVVTYRLSDKYVCLIENLDVGAAICRASGPSKMDALQKGLSLAKELVAASAPPRAVIDAIAPPTSQAVHIDRIVMEVDGLPVAYTVEEFNQMPVADRMRNIMGGCVTFFTPEGEAVPPAEAIELLRSQGA